MVYILIVAIAFIGCNQNKGQALSQNIKPSQKAKVGKQQDQSPINPSGKTIETRFVPPSDYRRVSSTEVSFATYLRQLPLKPHGTEVSIYDGRIKSNFGVYDAVVDLPIGNRDLHQCADAVMRLRAEYLWKNKRYEEIHFNFTNGFRVDYSYWMEGKRMVVEGNKTYWKNSGSPSNTYTDFWKYMELIFSYAGTLSLSKELQNIPINDLKIGDVFIQGGSPGHAVIVVDVAFHQETNQKIFLLAQSYMPAQEIQLLKNPSNDELSPWYTIPEESDLRTPEWTFQSTDLKRFK